MNTAKLSALRKGLLEFLVLGILASRRMYAADIIDHLGKIDFPTKEGTLYPLLSRLRREGLLDYDWQESAAGPPRKYYQLSAAGQQQLTAFRQYWRRLSTIIEELEEAPCEK